MKKKVLSALLAGAMCASLLVGCGGTKDEPETTGSGKDKEFTLRVVCSGEKDDGIDIATRLYKEKYPNATVETITSPWGDGGSEMKEKELVLINSGDTPDIGKMVWGKEFAREGLLMDLTEDIKKMDIYPNLTEGQLDRMTYDGKYFGMTFGNNSIVMFYNKDILEQAGWTEPPKTLDEVEQLGADIKAKGLKTADGKDIYLTNFEGGNWATDYWLWAGGGSQMNDDFTKTTIDSPESIAAFQRMQDMITNGYAPVIDGTGSQLWMNGQQALLFSGEWDVPGSTDAGINFGVTTTPVGPTDKNTVSIGGVEWAIFEGSKLKQEALDFIEILVSDEFAKEFGRGMTDPTLYDDAECQATWKEEGLYETKMIQRDQLAASQYNFLEAPFVYPEAKKIYADALEKILVKLDPVEATMKDAATQINTGLAAE